MNAVDVSTQLEDLSSGVSQYRWVYIFHVDYAVGYKCGLLYQVAERFSAVEVYFKSVDDACVFVNSCLDFDTHFTCKGNLISKDFDRS